MVYSANPSDDILTTGVDGQPTRMRATRCASAVLGDSGADGLTGAPLVLDGVRVYTGTCPMMAAVGWAGTPAALVGLDLLRPGAARYLVLDFVRSQLRVVF